MTTTADKRALRAGAEARRSRHAQRTPLPPKPETVRDARDAIEEAKAVGGDPITTIQPGDSKSWQKAKLFLAAVKPYGWNTISHRAEGSTIEEDVVEVILKRGEEVIWISWTLGGMTTEPMPTYTIGTRTIKLRNASAAKKIAARAPVEAEAELTRVTQNRAFKPRATTPKRSRLPFDPKLATDEEVIERLMGHSVSWHNRISERPEEAVVLPSQHRIEIREAEHGDRIVSFLCPYTGFRAFRLSALVRVGGKPVIEIRSGGRKIRRNGK